MPHCAASETEFYFFSKENLKKIRYSVYYFSVFQETAHCRFHNVIEIQMNAGIGFCQGVTVMSNVCEVCGKKKFYGSTIIRRGLAKKKGGIGMHVVKVSPRTFEPNIQSVRVKENGSVIRKKVCVSCIRSGKIQKAG